MNENHSDWRGLILWGGRSHLGAEFAESRVFVEFFEIGFAQKVFLADHHIVAEDADQDERADRYAMKDAPKRDADEDENA